MMKITFNSINAVTGVITNDEPLRQGNVGANTLTAVFEGKSNLAYTATFNYTRSDDGRLKDIPMTPTANAGEYYYKFSNPWFFAVYGETTLTVYLKNASNEIVASGQITFPIEQTDFDDDPNITYSEYELLLDAITAKQDKFEIYNVRGYNSLELAEADPGLDDGQIVIVRGNPTKIYQVQAGELNPLDSVGAYLPLSGGTMSGAISQPVAPVVDDDLANKKYVDDSVKVANDDIYDIIHGDITVHTAYHAEMDNIGRNLVDLAKTSDLTDGTITVKKAETAQKDFSGNVITTYYQPKLVWDTTPTQSSIKPVTSGGIKTYVDKIAIDKGSFTSVASFMHSVSPSYGGTYFANVVLSGYTYKYYAFVNFTLATVIGGATIYKYEYLNNQWTQLGVYKIGEELGSKLYLNTTDYKLYLRNYLDEDLSMVDLPLESVVVSGSYDDTTQSLVLTLQNGTEITIPVADLVDGLVPNTRTIAGVDLADDIIPSELKTALSLVKADVGLGNVINPNEYNNIGVATDLDTITISGTYTCYGNANGVPSADYSWFILHLNSGVGTAYAKQIAFAYDGKIYVRFKSTTWGAWAFIPASTLGFDNTIKNLLTATNLQEAVDEVSDRVVDIEAVIPSVASPTNQLTAKSEVVKIMPAPASTTLTDDEIAQITNGVHIEGSFLGYTNPVFFPAKVSDATSYYGMFNGADEMRVAVEAVYIIDKTTKVISKAYYTAAAFLTNGRTDLQIRNINDIPFPAVTPGGTEPYDLTIANKVYSFRERIYEYANMYLSNNATVVSLTDDTLTKFAIPMTGGASSGITISTADDNLTILKTGIYQIIVTFNTSVSVNDLELETAVYKNTSTAIPELKQIRTAKNASTIDTSTLQGIVSLTANDVIDVRVKADGDCDMTVINATISVRRIS